MDNRGKLSRVSSRVTFCIVVVFAYFDNWIVRDFNVIRLALSIAHYREAVHMTYLLNNVNEARSYKFKALEIFSRINGSNLMSQSAPFHGNLLSSCPSPSCPLESAVMLSI
jgi:hypothetical protein